MQKQVLQLNIYVKLGIFEEMKRCHVVVYFLRVVWASTPAAMLEIFHSVPVVQSFFLCLFG